MTDLSDQILDYLDVVKKMAHSYERLSDYDSAYADGLIGVWEALKSYQPGRAALRTWVHTCVRRSCQDHVRVRRKHVPSFVALGGVDIAGPAAPTYEDREEVRWLLKGLPREEKRLLKNCYWRDKTLREVGEELGVGESRVYQIRKQLLIRLKERIEESYAP